MVPKIILAACLIPLAATPLLAQTAPSFASDGEFSVCVDPTFPPLEFLEKPGDKVPVGFDVDLAVALAGAWQAEARFVAMDFNGLLPSLEAGRCDAIISGAYVTPEREEKFDAVGYLETKVVLIGKADATAIATADELAGKTVAVQSGTDFVARLEALQAENVAKGLAPMTIQQYPKQTDALQQLLVGRADLVVTQDTEVAFREYETPGQFSVVYSFPQSDLYAMFFRKTETDKPLVAKAVADLKASGALVGLLAKWKLPEDRITSVGN
jgi:polar amino acid transport system substrate-binding protein